MSSTTKNTKPSDKPTAKVRLNKAKSALTLVIQADGTHNGDELIAEIEGAAVARLPDLWVSFGNPKHTLKGEKLRPKVVAALKEKIAEVETKVAEKQAEAKDKAKAKTNAKAKFLKTKAEKAEPVAVKPPPVEPKGTSKAEVRAKVAKVETEPKAKAKVKANTTPVEGMVYPASYGPAGQPSQRYALWIRSVGSKRSDCEFVRLDVDTIDPSVTEPTPFEDLPGAEVMLDEGGNEIVSQSLSGAGSQITGTNCRGPAFWGLVSPTASKGTGTRGRSKRKLDPWAVALVYRTFGLDSLAKEADKRNVPIEEHVVSLARGYAESDTVTIDALQERLEEAEAALVEREKAEAERKAEEKRRQREAEQAEREAERARRRAERQEREAKKEANTLKKVAANFDKLDEDTRKEYLAKLLREQGIDPSTVDGLN